MPDNPTEFLLQRDLFEASERPPVHLAPGATFLPGEAIPVAAALVEHVWAIERRASWRHMHTPGGHRMSVAMTNCGRFGWVSDRWGYRYTTEDPQTGQPWPSMPPSFTSVARSAAARAGFPGFTPNACLINCYEPGASMSMHQDRNEGDFAHPIVSVSLGLPAVFRFGGAERGSSARKVPLRHGDVVVWGAQARLFFHGVDALRAGRHPTLGERRVNLTFRYVGPPRSF